MRFSEKNVSIEDDFHVPIYERANKWKKVFNERLYHPKYDTTARFTCGVCGEVINNGREVKGKRESLEILTPLRKNGNTILFERSVKKINDDDLFHVCQVCYDSLHSGKTPKYSICSMNLSWEFPSPLIGLTAMEKILISRVVIMQSIFTVNAQYSACRSNAVGFFNDPEDNLKRLKLPMHCSELVNYVYFVIPSPKARNQLRLLLNQNINPIPKFLQFLRVRKEKVFNALLFLKSNNKFYFDITVDFNVDLPTDGIPELLLQEIQSQASMQDDETLKSYAIRVPSGDPRRSHQDGEVIDIIDENDYFQNGDTITESIIDFESLFHCILLYRL